MDKRTKQVVEAALRLPDFERSALLHRMWALLDGGPETEVFEAALALPETGKWELVEKLLASLEDQEEDPIDRWWREEVDRRSEEIEAGQARGIPWSEVQERTRQILRDASG